MDYQTLEKKVDEYMLLADRGLLRLLIAFVVACKLPLPPPWIFIVTSSSGGKTKMIQLLKMTPGYFEIDDLTANTLLSGVKRLDHSASMLHQIPKNGFFVFKDFTSILSKNKESMQAIIGQLRLVYDGDFSKQTGLGDKVSFTGSAGLLAGVTTKIQTTAADWGEMGQRMVMYHMEQPENMDVGYWIIDKKRDEKAIEAEIRKDIADIVGAIAVPSRPEDLPDFTTEEKDDLVQISYLTCESRSPVEWTTRGYKRIINLKHDKEMMGRFLKQMMSLAYAMMLLNPGKKLTNVDRKILYKIGLDSIPQQRFEVMKALTANRLGGDIEQLADFLKYPKDTVQEYVEELVALGIVRYNKHYQAGGGTRKTYHIEDKFMDIISKFEGIKPEERELPKSEEQKETEAIFEAIATQ